MTIPAVAPELNFGLLELLFEEEGRLSTGLGDALCG